MVVITSICKPEFVTFGRKGTWQLDGSVDTLGFGDVILHVNTSYTSGMIFTDWGSNKIMSVHLNVEFQYVKSQKVENVVKICGNHITSG
jgi:hypothetical protein